MVSVPRLQSLHHHARRICEEDVPGDFVECGVAAGGSSALVAVVIKRYSKRPRRLYSCDSFEGMPTPTDEDAHDGVNAEDTGWGSGTCAAPQDSLGEICHALGVWELVTPVKGYFETTLPDLKNQLDDIAFLHLDGDWYLSTRDILANLYDKVHSKGFMQADDYGYWQGCSKALHEFEAQRGLRFKLQRIDSSGVWFGKPVAGGKPSA
ncbi:MAG: TylF/MycF family methyltransferase [Proteobacteria bacterium]|nr:TylF/MycF family methyltransferase [Pseudomonadota bacterium]